MEATNEYKKAILDAYERLADTCAYSATDAARRGETTLAMAMLSGMLDYREVWSRISQLVITGEETVDLSGSSP